MVLTTLLVTMVAPFMRYIRFCPVRHAATECRLCHRRRSRQLPHLPVQVSEGIDHFIGDNGGAIHEIHPVLPGAHAAQDVGLPSPVEVGDFPPPSSQVSDVLTTLLVTMVAPFMRYIRFCRWWMPPQMSALAIAVEVADAHHLQVQVSDGMTMRR